MLGPLTIKVGEIMDDYYTKLSSVMSSGFISSVLKGYKDTEFILVRIPTIVAAHSIYKGQEVHPKILWGNYWFLYSQAWLWKLSKSWRENVIEVNLKRFNDKGESEKALNDITLSITRSPISPEQLEMQ